MDEVFVDIDRPEEHLATIVIEIEGDASGGTSLSFASGLSLDQKRDLLRHAASELAQSADSSSWDEGGVFDRVEQHAANDRPTDAAS